MRHIQNLHMDERGWSDIGYSFVVCTHGWVYEGRGLKRRNSANGNTSLNEQDYAVLLMVGSSGLTKPTVEQLHGGRDAIEYCRKEGPAGAWLGGHRDGYATQCPGDALYAWVKRRAAPRQRGGPHGGNDRQGSVPGGAPGRSREQGGAGGAVQGGPADRRRGRCPRGMGRSGNSEWMAASIDIDTGKRVRALQAEAVVQNATIAELARTVAQLATNAAAVDVEQLLGRITQAIENVTVRLDVEEV
ncbi:peptidoglycan recognition family protein [Streptomyces noursei]|nr:peptidoglycan recognition family protein [Streptomyces noursei]